MKEQLVYEPIVLPKKGLRKFFRGAFMKGHINKVLAARDDGCVKLWAKYEPSIWKPVVACIRDRFSYCNSHLIPSDKLCVLLATDEINDMSVVELVMSLESEFGIIFPEGQKLNELTLGELVALITPQK